MGNLPRPLQKPEHRIGQTLSLPLDGQVLPHRLADVSSAANCRHAATQSASRQGWLLIPLRFPHTEPLQVCAEILSPSTMLTCQISGWSSSPLLGMHGYFGSERHLDALRRLWPAGSAILRLS